MNLSSIKSRIVFSMIFILVVSVTIMGYIAYSANYAIQTEMMEQATKEKVQQVKKVIDDREANLQITKEALNRNLIIATKAIERSIEGVAPEQLNQELTKQASIYGIDEIHVTDEKGILTWSNIPQFIGYDFNSAEQSKVFIGALTDSKFELVQDPTPRGADEVLFQYVGVARKSEKGLVQIGIAPEEFQKLIERIHISKIANTLGDENVQVAILDSEGKIISHTNNSMVDRKIQEFEFANKIMDNDSGSFLYKLEKEQKLLTFESYNLYRVIATTNTKQYISKANDMLRIMILASLMIFFFAGVITLIIAGRIANPIKILAQIINRIAKYDLTLDESSEAIKYLKRKDEIGLITNSLAAMQMNFIDLVKSISHTSQQVAASSGELTATSQQTSTAVEEVGRTIEEIANGANEQAKNTEDGVKHVNQLGSLIENDQKYIADLNSSANEVDVLKDEGLEFLKDLMEKTEVNNSASNDVHEIIISTNESAEKIENASQMIKSIADQTNLLALNAAIEAARAGEAGRGFAVVAEEIKKLAEQSNIFTGEISQVIQDLITKTSHAVKVMHKTGEVMVLQTESVKKTNEKFQGIDSAIEKMKKVIVSINQSGQEMETKKDHIIQIIENLSAISEENAAGTEEASASVEEQTASMEQVANASQELAKLAEEMKESVSKFKF